MFPLLEIPCFAAGSEQLTIERNFNLAFLRPERRNTQLVQLLELRSVGPVLTPMRLLVSQGGSVLRMLESPPSGLLERAHDCHVLAY